MKILILSEGVPDQTLAGSELVEEYFEIDADGYDETGNTWVDFENKYEEAYKYGEYVGYWAYYHNTPIGSAFIITDETDLEELKEVWADQNNIYTGAMQ